MDINIDKETQTTVIKCSAIIGLVVIEVFALSQGIDGTLMFATGAAIAGIAGYTVGKGGK